MGRSCYPSPVIWIVRGRSPPLSLNAAGGNLRRFFLPRSGWGGARGAVVSRGEVVAGSEPCEDPARGARAIIYLSPKPRRRRYTTLLATEGLLRVCARRLTPIQTLRRSRAGRAWERGWFSVTALLAPILSGFGLEYPAALWITAG